ncbi:unnamed protein product [Polarella glacialis]|uniref:Cytochrome b5 heme-binding domain-containing protein n=1 Tax=Polarella glacialis TaxID=89957 RepID=A0A813KUE4_POLGL|nr:unnamed protein product [Polarella glacialis]
MAVASDSPSVLGVSTSVVVTVLLGVASALAFLWRRIRKDENETEEDEPTGAQEELPADGIFTIESLGRFNGVTGPLCMGVCGKVVNVSSSENITVGQGYGKLWAGRDATYSLATLSLKMEDANTMDFTLDQFTPDQVQALAGWYKHFTHKYPIVGRLTEYENWDFGTIEEEAKSQTPFGLGKDKAADSDAAPAKASPAPEEGVMMRAGDKVLIQGVESRTELNGRIGTLLTFVAEKGRFAVKLEGEEDPILLKPDNLSKAAAS